MIVRPSVDHWHRLSHLSLLQSSRTNARTRIRPVGGGWVAWLNACRSIRFRVNHHHLVYEARRGTRSVTSLWGAVDRRRVAEICSREICPAAPHYADFVPQPLDDPLWCSQWLLGAVGTLCA